MSAILVSAFVAAAVAAIVGRIVARAERRDAALARLSASAMTWEALPAASVLGEVDDDGNLRAPSEVEAVRVECLLAGLIAQNKKITSLNRELAAQLIHAREYNEPIEDLGDIRRAMAVALIETRHEATFALEARNTLLGSISPGLVMRWKRWKRTKARPPVTTP